MHRRGDRSKRADQRGQPDPAGRVAGHHAGHRGADNSRDERVCLVVSRFERKGSPLAWEFSGRIELVVWAIPLLTILLLAGVAWIGSHAFDPYKPILGQGEPLEVQVVSLDWKWLFIYPEKGIASVNELAVPAGRALHFTHTSSSKRVLGPSV